jgi:UDP-N-acetylglucosamine--N-acetylmuramyl-(pentapeptide) pyrophosphoryl-undecaprenol N-acetylglucosamine transferase
MPHAQKIKILITGGGTGGHIFPAIAIADAIRAARPDAEFLFVGAKGKMEMERVPLAGYTIEGLNIAGFQRGLSFSSLRRNLSFPFKLIGSALRAKRILHAFQPDVVIGTGGYASGAVMRAAQQLGLPTVIQEQNSFPGVTNRLLAKQAACICVAYDGMERFFPADKIRLTGNPVRQDLTNLVGGQADARAAFGLDPTKKTIYLTGGSMGARTLNEAMAAAHNLLRIRPDTQVLWQCGRFYHAKYQTCDTAQLPNVRLVPFVDRVDQAYAAADVIIARAGALTISELCIVGKPVVLTPSPNVAEDHQTKNALALTQVGAARIVRDAEAVEKLLPEALLVLENEALAFAMSECIRSLARPNAAGIIADIVLNLLAKLPVKNEKSAS